MANYSSLQCHMIFQKAFTDSNDTVVLTINFFYFTVLHKPMQLKVKTAHRQVRPWCPSNSRSQVTANAKGNIGPEGRLA